MLCLKCPGSGISWKNKHQIIGTTALRNIDKDTTLDKHWFA